MRLDLEDVSAAYGSAVVLRDLSMSVPAGQVVALLGANGAGKTSLLKVVSGLLRPRAGRVLLDDQDVSALGSDSRARMGVCHITEGRSVFPDLTVRDNVRLFTPRGKPAASVEEALDCFPALRPCMPRPAGSLSGGQQQMLALLRAYLSDAPLVLFDEISMGLAPVVVDQIFEFLDHLRTFGRSLLVVEQYVAKALAIADVVYILAKGRIVYAGEPAELRGSTQIMDHYFNAEGTRRRPEEISR
ncbi:MAG TPA: ABC transporter ATP-binding protein [Acidimicrobiales bacterium]